MNELFLVLGSNLGNRFLYLEKAIQELENRVGRILVKSSLYETEPFGFETEYLFVNQVIKLQTLLSPQQVLSTTQTIEKELGRIPIPNKIEYESRVIDIDILFYGNQIVNEKNLQLPHIQLHKRRFTLVPLCEIASDWIHPLFNESIKQLLEQCPDRLNVVRIEKE